MIEFRTHLQKRVMDIAKDILTTEVKTYDDHLHDLDDLAHFPFLVVNVRTAEKSGDSEIGTGGVQLWNWTVHIYYLDINADYKTADERRNNILSRLELEFEKNKKLNHLDVSVEGIGREYVWNTSISAVLFDYSGQEEYHSFVSELYLNVETAKG